MTSNELDACPFCGSHLERNKFQSTRSVERRTHPADAECILSGIIISMEDRDDDRERRAAWNTRALSATRPVRVVKPIEWGKTSYGSPEAFTVVGVYRINSATNGGWSVAIKDGVLRDTDGRTNFATVETAKAAAQTDFERRILSALSITEGE